MEEVFRESEGLAATGKGGSCMVNVILKGLSQWYMGNEDGA